MRFLLVLSLYLVGCADVAVQPTGLSTGAVRQHLDAALAAASAWQVGAALIGVAGDHFDSLGQIVCDPANLSSGWRFDFYGDGKSTTFRYLACGDAHGSGEVPGAAPNPGRGLGLDFLDSTAVADKLSAVVRAHRFTNCEFSASLHANGAVVKNVDPLTQVWDAVAACDDLSLRMVMDARSGQVYSETARRTPR